MKEFSDYVAIGTELVKQRSGNAWALGDFFVEATNDLDIKPGRPVDPEAPTLGDLAHAIDLETPRASEFLKTAGCFPPNLRTYELSWSHYNMARRAAEGSRENALELLAHAELLHLGIRAFKRYLNGEYFEGMVERRELPERLQAMLPPSVLGVWMTLKRLEQS